MACVVQKNLSYPWLVGPDGAQNLEIALEIA